MTKYLLLLAFIVLSFNTSSAKSILSPGAKKLTHELQNRAKSNRLLSASTKIDAMLKYSGNFDFEASKSLGVIFPTIAGDIATARIPAEIFAKFSEMPGIEYLETGNRIVQKLDSARILTHAFAVNNGAIAPVGPLNGEGVVVGIIDSGFDYTHPAFRDADGNLRIKRVWEQFRSGVPPTGFDLGNELTTQEAIIAGSHDLVAMSHGTHVAGIVAGSEIPGVENYRGVAKDAEIVIVALRPPTQEQWISGSVSDVVNAVNYIFNYAESVGKPAVVNLSWGCLVGPQDGSSLFSQAIDNLTGKGKIFLASAGNSGNDNIHIEKTFTADDSLLCTYFRCQYDKKNVSNGNWLGVWGEPNCPFEFNYQIYDYMTKSAVYETGFISTARDTAFFDTYVASNGTDTFNIAFTAEINPNNNKPHVLVDIEANAATRIRIYAKAKSGTVHLWNEYIADYHGNTSPFVTLSDPQAIEGDPHYTLSDLCSGKNTIAVGATVSKTRYQNLKGNTIDYGRTAGTIAPFSSRGPGLTPNTYKPDISAPGMTLISAVNSADTTYYGTNSNAASVVAQTDLDDKPFYYAAMSGTSMSCPFTSGCVALMLQAFPTLSPQEIINAMKYNAADELTGEVPNERFGNGKLNLMNAFTAILQGLSVENNEISVGTYPNPFSSNLTIEAAGIAGATLAITDLNGNAISIQILQNDKNEITMPDNLPSGMYNFAIIRGNTIIAKSKAIKL